MKRVFGGQKRSQVLESDSEEAPAFDIAAEDGEEGSEKDGEDDEDGSEKEGEESEKSDGEESEESEKDDGDEGEKADEEQLQLQMRPVSFGLLKAKDVHVPDAKRFKLLVVRIGEETYVPKMHIKRLVPRSQWNKRINEYVSSIGGIRKLSKDDGIDRVVHAVSGMSFGLGGELIPIKECALALKSFGPTCISTPDNLDWVPEFKCVTEQAVAEALDSTIRYAKYLEEEKRPKRRRAPDAEMPVAKKAPAPASVEEMPVGKKVAFEETGSIASRARAFIDKMGAEELSIVKSLVAAGDWGFYLSMLKEQGCGVMEASWIKMHIGSA